MPLTYLIRTNKSTRVGKGYHRSVTCATWTGISSQSDILTVRLWCPFACSVASECMYVSLASDKLKTDSSSYVMFVMYLSLCCICLSAPVFGCKITYVAVIMFGDFFGWLYNMQCLYGSTEKCVQKSIKYGEHSGCVNSEWGVQKNDLKWANKSRWAVLMSSEGAGVVVVVTDCKLRSSFGPGSPGGRNPPFLCICLQAESHIITLWRAPLLGAVPQAVILPVRMLGTSRYWKLPPHILTYEAFLFTFCYKIHNSWVEWTALKRRSSSSNRKWRDPSASFSSLPLGTIRLPLSIWVSCKQMSQPLRWSVRRDIDPQPSYHSPL